MKRTGNSLAESSRSAKKAKPSPVSKPLQPENPDLQTWEVEGVEYIFAAPDFGTGYYVLRCNHGLSTKPEGFTVHPFDTGAAETHFNGTTGAICHDTSREYSKQDIMMEFAHRGNIPFNSRPTASC